ncbi:MAG TPA: MGMT family protein [Ilumatobacteraceae bacterium]|nr:MGMT family protein [Ilumatobacteraceae bacterium]
MDRDAEIFAVLHSLLPGEVTTYGDVAATAGYPGRARLVGTLLGGNHDAPWWRVVNSVGRLCPGAEAEQASLLRAEGVTIRDNRVRAAPIGRFYRPSPSATRPAGRRLPD